MTAYDLAATPARARGVCSCVGVMRPLLRTGLCCRVKGLRPAHARSTFKTASAAGSTTGEALSNRMGAHALVWVGGLTEQEVRRSAEGAAGSGYSVLEIPLLDPDSVDPDMIKRVLEEYSLTGTASLGLPFDADVSSDDPEVVARGEQRLEVALRLASGFGARHLCGILYSAFGKYSAPPTMAGRDNSVAAMRRLGRKAADSGVQVNLEVVNRYETNLLNTAEQARAFCDDVADPNVRIHLDTYHMNIEERSFADAVRTCGERLGYVHLGESHRGHLGTGTVAWPEFFGALREAGYQGPLTFESFSNKVVAPYCVDALCVWRNLWEDSDALAKAANSFVREQWESAGSR